MLLDVLSIFGGLLLLVLGADALVGSASALAVRARIPAAVVGVTVVAWGTSMPELVVSVNAALTGRPDVAMGNVVGSNIYNIALILGLSALIQPLVVARQTLRLDTPVMLFVALALFGFARDGTLSTVEGALLLTVAILHTAALYRLQTTAPAPAAPTEAAAADKDADAPGRLEAALVGLASGWLVLVSALSIVVLGVGARLLIDGAVVVAEAVGISQRVIGLTVVALGTSLPELFASVVAALRGRDDIAISNVVGSNLFNVAGILGITALILPVTVHPQILSVDMLWVIGLSVALLLLMVVGRQRLGRPAGGLLLLAALIYTATLAQ